MANIMWNEILEQGLNGLKSVLNSTYQWVPQLLIAVLFIVAGLIFGRFSKWFIIKLSNLSKFNELTKKTGTDAAIHKIGYKGTPTSLIGDVLKGVIYLLFFAAALQILFGSEFLTKGISVITSYAPKVIAALVILIGGLIVSDIIGKMIGKIIQNYVVQSKNNKTVILLSETITKILIFSVAAIISLAMIGVYVEVLTISFAIVFLGIILLLLAGTRDLLPNLFAGMYLQSTNRLHKGLEIQIDGLSGTIIETGTLFTILKTKKGEIQVPNNKILKDSTYILE